ncbi:hypothetical protein TI39_contig4297g00003 [Zymoseptoria brevis]|uniref:Ntf2-like protein n=1 Tax=Zymoseptoria brevis TaxID=1047168 RepID=A0A0F4G846_9PEZI|nr:hypothetical protein TI39_contig4297g00003 [Zymoseptoria brevis]
MAYLSFLRSPTTAALADDASLNYITTTTAIKEPTAILKHIAAQSKQLEKKEEKVLNVIEGDNGCCVETLTTLLFQSGGGAYLPSMDSNLLDERQVTFAVTHVVTYNSESKIQQIRLYWDQGTLLKQVEAIGRTGRNWPIRDGKAQADFVTASVKAGNSSAPGNGNGNHKPSAARDPNEVVISQHSKRDSFSATRDPHASLSLFSERDANDSGRSYEGPKYSTAKSAKPAPREYDELFTNGESAAALAIAGRSSSPHKTDGTILKAGAGKHYAGNRLFDQGKDMEDSRSPERKKTYNQKYEHFAFGDGEDAPTKENRPFSKGQGEKNNTTFSFEDFSTPPKHIEKPRRDDERHWGADVDEDYPPSPPKRPIVHAPRKDADSHFDMTDASEGPVKEYEVGKSLQRQKGMGLYQDPTMEDERTSYGSRSAEKTVSTNTNNSRRGDDFGPHYSMSDNSPAGSKGAQAPNKRGTRTDLSTNWGFDGQVDAPKKIYKTAGDGMGSRKVAEEPTTAPKKIYKTAGDGMGSRSGGRAWGIGDESDPEIDADVRPSARTRRAQAQAGADLDF